MFFSLSYIRSFPYSIQQSKWYACQKKLLVHTKSTMLIELLSEGSLVYVFRFHFRSKYIALDAQWGSETKKVKNAPNYLKVRELK